MKLRHHRKTRQRAMDHAMRRRITWRSRRLIAFARRTGKSILMRAWRDLVQTGTGIVKFDESTLDLVWLDETRDDSLEAMLYGLSAYKRADPVSGSTAMEIIAKAEDARPRMDHLQAGLHCGLSELSDSVRRSYWCPVCLRALPIDGGVIVHDDIPHPETMTYDEEDNPQ